MELRERGAGGSNEILRTEEVTIGQSQLGTGLQEEINVFLGNKQRGRRVITVRSGTNQCLLQLINLKRYDITGQPPRQLIERGSGDSSLVLIHMQVCSLKGRLIF